jgi:hypothetical protein
MATTHSWRVTIKATVLTVVAGLLLIWLLGFVPNIAAAMTGYAAQASSIRPDRSISANGQAESQRAAGGDYAAFGGATPTLTPCAGSVTFLNRSITASDTPLPNRLSQNGIASMCGTSKPFPGTIPVAGRHFDQYVLTNNSTIGQCITVTLFDAGCGVNRAVMSAAYLGSFDPNNLSQNYLADLGQSVNAGNPQGVYSFDVAAGQQFVVIVYDIGTLTDCTNYTLRVEGCLVGGPTLTPTRTPTPSPTRTASATFTRTATNTPTATSTNAQPSNTATRTSTPLPNTATHTTTRTPTRTSTPLLTNTPGGPTSTPTASNTSTFSPTHTHTALPTSTPGGPTDTPPPTHTNTPTRTRTSTPPPTNTPGGATATPTACALQFSDVPQTHAFYQYVRCLACRNILGGYADQTFRPSNNITRGQLSKIVSNSAGYGENPSGQSFQDVLPGSAFYVYIERMVLHGVISGYDCGSPGEPCVPPSNLPYFRPNSDATRGQISKIVSNAAGLDDPPGAQRFQDVPPDSPFFVWIQRLSAQGIISGYDCGSPGEPCVPPNSLPYFRPGNKATRGQVSKIVAGAFFPNCYTPGTR